MASRTIVVIEDELSIAGAIGARLNTEGFRVELATDGTHGVELCELCRPDLVVLDLMLPGMDGLEVCRRIQKDRHIPVLMLTARDTEADVLVGLAVGADDYLTKPFSQRELVARINAILRRVEVSAGTPQPVISFGDIRINASQRRVDRQGAEVHLTPTEFDLLICLAMHPGDVFSRRKLLNDVWGYSDPHGSRTIDSHIRALRRKLGSTFIRTIHGVGYALELPGISDKY